MSCFIRAQLCSLIKHAFKFDLISVDYTNSITDYVMPSPGITDTPCYVGHGVWILESLKISSICCINGSQTKLNIVSLVQNYFTAQEILISVSSDMSAAGQPLATSYSEES